MNAGMKLNEGKFYVQGEDGKERELGVAKDITPVEPDLSKCTYADIDHLGINKEYGITLNLANTHKVWKKKRKGKRWVWYCVEKPYRLDFGALVSKFYSKYHKKLIDMAYGPKKPRGKSAKSIRNYIRFCNEWTKKHFTDYVPYTKDCEEVEMKYPGDDEIYKYKVLERKDDAKLEAIITKRIDEIKGK